MGTRGLIGFRINGVDKLTYNHSDSYPSELGKRTLAFFRNAEASKLAFVASKIKMVDEDRKPTKLQVQKVSKFLETENNDHKHWYGTLGAAQGDWDVYYQGLPFMMEYASFIECTMCEWVYLYNVDSASLEIYSDAHWWGEKNIGRYNKHYIDGESSSVGARLLISLPLHTINKLTQSEIDYICQLIDDEGDKGSSFQFAKKHKSAGSMRSKKVVSEWLPFHNDWEIQIEVKSDHCQASLKMYGDIIDMPTAYSLTLNDPYYGLALMNMLDRQILQYTIAIYGRNASFAEYVKVMHLRKYITNYDVTSQGLPLLDIIFSYDTKRFAELTLNQKAFEKLKVKLIRGGLLTNQAWKSLLRQPSDVLAKIVKNVDFDYYFERDIKVLNLIAEAIQIQTLNPKVIQLMFDGIRNICRWNGYSSERGHVTSEVNISNAMSFVRTLNQLDDAIASDENFEHVVVNVRDYVRNLTTALPKVTWKSLVNRSEAWHFEIQVKEVEAYQATWTSRLGVYPVGTLLAIELNSSQLLVEESYAMHHCVKSYISECVAGESRIFSIRKDGKRVATLEIQPANEGKWKVAQLRGFVNGKSNQHISDSEIMKAANQIALAYQKNSQNEFDQKKLQTEFSF